MNNADHVPARFQAAVDRLDGSTELLREMAAITTEDIPHVLAACRSAIDAGQCTLAASHLHKLKGMLSTFESGAVTLEIQELVDLARTGQVAELRVRFTQYRGEINQLIQEIAQLAGEFR